MSDHLDALFCRVNRGLPDRTLGAEITHHLGYGSGGETGPRPNRRNGTTPKTVFAGRRRGDARHPRDRAGTFAPQLPAGVRSEGGLALPGGLTLADAHYLAHKFRMPSFPARSF